MKKRTSKRRIAVAEKIALNSRNGELQSMAEMMREQDYSPSVVNRPSDLTSTPSFQEEIAPLADRLGIEQNRIMRAMSTKALEKEDYKTLVASLDVVTKNRQLLSGGATERRILVLPSDVMSRNAINESDPKLLDGSIEPLSST